ncbi:uroporphyrinogen-III synthase [Corynebacterium sp. 153RC1]|nr:MULTISPECIES: uroporphyrinogen-III synthase [unclassified Corynebacterium]MCQ9370525.1 uroporphyrinogen-III synthase [Corynebacterium sp. 35RC1]MCQ9351776.1 uroporphyrinogen-III synthase [Corynebacterium sp. 209RC1]MCQ9354512.1 uroporphyrinogen-III synthase [Corynebacterium sp. 1222RC1]MCQ9356058.1 uroporphyrinogen-III synthase [Corynebacterium sp. 122RC1]MCQ9358690.1 uroporphyrinogen-III synthase [Corynebacterium sp. 142RC1]
MSQALHGWRVVLPRAQGQAGEMAAMLERLGAVPELVPTITFTPAAESPLMDALMRGPEWVVFTSATAVQFTLPVLRALTGGEVADLSMRVAAVGPATAAALQAHGIPVDLMPAPEHQDASGVVAAFPHGNGKGLVVLPRADIATEELPTGLKAKGWEVVDVPAYHTVPAPPPSAQFVAAWQSGKVQAVCFTSGSTARNLVAMAGKPHPSVVVACIGPKCARVAQDLGLRVDVVPEVAQGATLVEALASYARTHAKHGTPEVIEKRENT